MENLKPFLSRKFLFCLLLTILSFVLVLVGKLTPKEWTDFAMVVGSIYIVGNMGVRLADGIKTE